MHAESWKHRVVRMSTAALLGAAVLGLGTTAQRIHAGGGCADYACATNKGCESKGCDTCASSNSRCANVAY